MTADEIAKILTAHEAIAAHEKELTGLVAARAQAIRVAMQSGVSARVIADALGVDRSRVYRMGKNNYADSRRV